MILQKLVLSDVGTFGGRHEIDLSPTEPDKPITLIGGLNGAGKTTVLEAIQLALYGPLATSSARRTGSYEKYLRGLIHHGVPESAGSFVELVFSAHQEGVERTYRVRRLWKSAGASMREVLLVFVDERYDQALSSSWSEYVETFLPRGIAGLFFFDGEQIEALADLDRSREVLCSALSALLGLDLVDRLDNDLAVLKRRRKVAAVPNELRLAVEEKQRLVTAHRQAEEVAVARVAQHRTEMERAAKLLRRAEEAYRGAGGDLLETRDAAESSAMAARQALDESEDAIRADLAGIAPLLQLQPMLRRLLAQARREKEAQKARLLGEEFLERDNALLSMLRSRRAAKRTIQAIEGYLAGERAKHVNAASAETIAEIADCAGLATLVQDEIPTARSRMSQAMAQRAELQEQLDQAERLVAATPDPETLLPLRGKVDAATIAARQEQAALEVSEAVLSAAKSERIKARQALDALLDKTARAEFAVGDDQRVQTHIDLVRATLTQLRKAASGRHLERISDLVMDALGVLLRKDNLITGLSIDPETYTVSLTGLDNRPLSASELSAGERQLLAVALLWGLARAAGQPLPVVIDTPLGRLDKSHRTHLLERYFPNASHQVILLSTDTEIDRDAFTRIAPHVGRSYRLDFDAASGATEVTEGYFWRQP
jgi:DNA sulfur modification protein DndD